LGKKKADAFSSLRITLGKQTTKSELDYALKVIKAIVKQERELKR
jgi:cysteine sulfinate desulfinase/cysteine desulfurase-like protein